MGILAYRARAEDDGTLVERMVQAFQLGTLMQRRDLGGAYNFNTLLTTSTGQYVLRVYRPWTSDERLALLQHVKDIVHASGIPVPLPLSTSEGKTFLRYADRLVEVEPFVVSDAVANTWEHCALVCSLLGKLHAVLSSQALARLPFIPPYHSNYATPAVMLEWTQQSIERIQAQSLTAPAQDVQNALDLCAITTEQLATLQIWWQQSSQSLPQQLTHGDYKGDNMLLRQEHIVALLDFDFLGIRERLFDLAYLLYWMFLNVEDMRRPAQLSWSRAATMLAHYDAAAHQPLTDVERRALPLEIARVPLFWIGEAHFIPDTISAVAKFTMSIHFSQWVLLHSDELADLFSQRA